MLKYALALALAGAFAITAPGKPAATAGAWQVDLRHSDAKLTTDGTTDFGKKKIDVVLGFGRVNGQVKLDDANPAQSSIHLHIYPATAMSETIEEDGKFKTQWLANPANQTLLCFRSKQISRTADGKLQASGELKLTRVDRNVQADPTEAYQGPVYGPPMTHTVSRSVTFVFDFTPGNTTGQMGGSTSMTREMFPQLLKAVVNTYWPPVVQDAKCEAPPAASEDYRGGMCTGTVLQPPALPQSPYSGAREDAPGPSDYNMVSGNNLTIVLHLRLNPSASGQGTATGD
jgi:polyisoprenoid-binding protein YceI